LDAASTKSAQNAVIPPVPVLAFGQEEWTRYFGDVGEVPPLPENIAQILDISCSLWENKKVSDTHLLTLIPAQVNSRPFSLDLLGELIKDARNGAHKTGYQCYDEQVKAQIGKQSPNSSYWVLMTRDVLPKSRSLDATQQETFVEDHARKTGLSYELPTALEAATTILMHYTCTGEYLFKENPKTYARCHGLISKPGDEYQRYNICVGNFSRWGLCISCPLTGLSMCNYTLVAHGVAASRKL
jgi:hypothetical protein